MLKITIVCFVWMNASFEAAPAVDIASEEPVQKVSAWIL